jgi:hypothetical protein
MSGLAIAGAGESAGCSAAIRSGSDGAGVVVAWSGGGVGPVATGSAGSATTGGAVSAGALSGAFSAIGGSTRSIDSIGLEASPCCAKFVSGEVCHDGVLANVSWAARSSAAAPSPNTMIDIDSAMAANRKRKPGSMDAGFRLRGISKSDIRKGP